MLTYRITQQQDTTTLHTGTQSVAGFFLHFLKKNLLLTYLLIGATATGIATTTTRREIYNLSGSFKFPPLQATAGVIIKVVDVCGFVLYV